MAIFRTNRRLFSSPRSLLFSHLQRSLVCQHPLQQQQQRWTHESVGEGGVGQFEDSGSSSYLREGSLDPSTWRTVDSRTFGIKSSDISSSTWTVLKILQKQGFEAYLVGGCVRDLILRKTPKDFDVVTTASLAQIKKQFHRCMVVGRRFPICQVFIFGSKIEVSSFETIYIDAQVKEITSVSRMASICNEKDFVRWKDSIRRDFTINGLFYDPFAHTIYDYVNGIRDVMASEVQTVIPAHLSFTEDCARILRGLRLVARLGLQFSEDTAIAVEDLSCSVVSLGKARLIMELNFMLAYGAAVPSICLLQKYKLLDVFLPIQAAYLADQNRRQAGKGSVMLMKLFIHLDKLLATDRPSDCSLWLGLLAFHLALVNNPQNATVIWTFASILYLGTWDRGMNFVREHARGHIPFTPEILELSGTESGELLAEESISDELLAEKTSHLVSLIKSSIYALVDMEALQESLAKYQIHVPPSDAGHLVFVSERAGRHVAQLFDVLEGDPRSYAKERETFYINYELLKRGHPDETRFVLGRVIFDTLNSELACQDNQNTSMHMLNGRVIQQQKQNSSIYKPTKEFNHQQNWKESRWTSKSKLIRQQNWKESTRRSNIELIHQQHANTIINQSNNKLTEQQIENASMNMSNDELDHHQNQDEPRISNVLIHQRNQNTGTHTSEGDLICQQHQNESQQEQIAEEMRQLLTHTFTENAVGKSKEDAHIRQETENGKALKKRLVGLSSLFDANATEGKPIPKQSQKGNVVKKRHAPLSELFR